MRRALICLVVLFATPKLRAGDGPELTPLADPPAVVVVPANLPPGVGFPMRNRLDVWQYYAVDRSGYWRPRVALAYPEPFYLYNGAPYPYLPVRPRAFLPYIFD